MKYPLFITLFSLVLMMMMTLELASGVRIPFLSKKYTPLVFFKVPPGLIPECDAMEKAVSQVEKELGVRVERLDVLREPASEAVLTLLTARTPPFLYNRESCQTVHITPTTGGGKSKTPVFVDKARIRAWAKGRYLPPASATIQEERVKSPVVLSQEEKAIEQDELLEDAMLTPLQRKGKQAIKDRTDAQAAKSDSDSDK